MKPHLLSLANRGRSTTWLCAAGVALAILPACQASERPHAGPCDEAKAVADSHAKSAVAAQVAASNVPLAPGPDEDFYERANDKRLEVDAVLARGVAAGRLWAHVVVDNATCFSVKERAVAREVLSR